jgi:aminopeptidase
MADPRVDKLARVLVHYSMKVRKGDLVRIGGAAISAPHIAAAYREVLLAGGHPTVRCGIDGLDEAYYKLGSDEQMRFISELDRREVELLNCELRYLGAYNTRALTRVPPERMRIRREATREIMSRFMERAAKRELRWCLTQAPAQADAQEAEMSLADYEDFVYKAGHLDKEDPVGAWQRVEREQAAVVERLGKVKTIRIVAPDTDLTVGVGGRTWISAAGEHNFPDGEVFTGPVENATNGTVKFTFPAIYGGREVTGIRLAFKDGRVTEARADKGEEFLTSMLDIDAGSRVLGEFAFGLNYEIQQFTRNILFDEKIGGSIHMALGAAYPDTGGKNQSGLHWDMILDLRSNGGEAFADGEVVYRNGRFLS